MKNWQKYLVVAGILLGAGALRIPYEEKLTEELREAKLITPPLPIGTREKIGQTSSAVALGGLRTLVATFLNLRAFNAFTEQRWDDVKDNFNTIVDLAPHTPYYWDTGAWHMASNAAQSQLENQKLSPLRRRVAWRASILEGRAFLERGIRNNPESWDLYRALGSMLTDQYKIRAFPDRIEAYNSAVEAFKTAADSGSALPVVRRSQLYALGRILGREKEALALAHHLYDSRIQNRVPTLLCLMMALEAHEGELPDPTKRAVELFGSDEKAYKALVLYWREQKNFFPVDGIGVALKTLEARLSIPAEKSIFNEKIAPPTDTQGWFDH